MEESKVTFSPSWSRAFVISARFTILTAILLGFMISMSNEWGGMFEHVFFTCIIAFTFFFYWLAVKSWEVFVTEKEVDFVVVMPKGPDTHQKYPLKGTKFTFKDAGFLRWVFFGTTAVVAIRLPNGRRKKHSLTLTNNDLRELGSLLAPNQPESTK